MWKKDEALDSTPSNLRPEESPPRVERPTQAGGERATIGRSISIRGEVTGDEDLLVQGQVDGSVDLKNQSVTVGQEGRVKANITGRLVIVEGEVEGDLQAEEQIILRSTAKVQGDIKAPRVVLEDGASFRGGVDMGDPLEKEKGTRASPAAQPAKATEPTITPSEPKDALEGSGKEAPEKAAKAAG